MNQAVYFGPLLAPRYPGQVTQSIPSSLAEIPAAVESALDNYFASRHDAIAGISPVTEQVALVLKDFTLNGGKRIRPTFAWLGWAGTKGLTLKDAAAQPEALSVLRTVSSLEFLQACALIHDDIIDSSDTRRGQPTVHRRFSVAHAERSWLGHGETYGRSVAILVGDLALSWADDMFMEGGLSPAPLQRAWEAWREMRTEVVCGQILDITAEAQGDSSVMSAQRVNRYKTAAYTVERPLHIGAAIAGADPSTIAALRAFGRAIGVAFQLRDDQLGVFGDPEVTGKPSGDDLREGKRTVLVALALEHSDARGRRELEAGLGTPLAADEVARLRTIIEESGASKRVEERIDALTAEALELLKDAHISEEVAQSLERMALISTQRRK